MSTPVVDTVNTPVSRTLREGAFGNATHLVCRECSATQPLGAFYACAECFGPLEIGYEFPAVTREQIEAGPKNIWRYQPLLPVPTDIATSPNMEPGFTRLIKAHNLGRALGMKNLWVKDDSGNPTHSFKDRVVAVALSAARELDMKVFACPSTGNLANAVAAAGARAGIKTVVFIPHDLERPKVLTTAVYGGTLIAVKGNYDDVNRLASEIAGEEEGWAFVNANVRPYYAEGSKTLGYEVAELLGHLVPQRLGPLGVVRTHIGVHERPALLLAGDLRGEPVDVVVVALHGDQRAAVHRGGEHLRTLEVVRDEDDGLDARAGAGRRDGVGQVARRRAGEDLHVELASGAERNGDHAVLEGVRRVARVVLHPEVLHAERAPEVVGLDEPGEAGLYVRAGGDVGRHRQQRLVAPDVRRPRLDLRAGDGREVVADLERAEALLA